ncbi:MAG: hypothetical protein KDB01_22555 [Planctomycetaceae bacterium]|nr:hypothetical protein [Planctomycetaceae bacterium]
MPIQPYRNTPHELFDRLEPVSGSPFVCPGNTSPVTRAIHLARLNVAWAGCDHCEWRFDSEGLAERTVLETARIRSHRIDGIRRTEFGIRGQYINDLDRQTAADLTRVFCACLHEQSSFSELDHGERGSVNPSVQNRSSSVSSPPETEFPTAAFQSIAPVIVGYDGRSASVDLAIGVVAACREFGITVLDAGRCTAASIQEAVRCFAECSGSILVTGADSPNAWAGIDVFDRGGDAVPVVWKDFGVQLEHVSLDTDSWLKLQLPDTAQRTRWARRLSRQSGVHEVLSFEDRYRDWLLRWYPRQSSLRILMRTDDVLQQQRAAWLSQTIGLEIICRSKHDLNAPPHVGLTMTVAEDDRQFDIVNAHGQSVSTERLALAINRAMVSQTSHITAHADVASNRFWLTDAARSGDRKSTESIHDALATLGLITRLMESRQLPADF